jgi:DNA polymerase elongation subunit (family B)
MSSKFYTDVHVHRGTIRHSYYEDGEKCYSDEPYCPSLFMQTNKPSNFHDVHGNTLEQIAFGSIKEYNEYKKNYGQALELFGSIEPKYQFISEEYPVEMQFDAKRIRTLLYDIEVINIDDDPALNGFPRPEDAAVPVVGVTIKDLKSKKIWVLATVDYNPKKTILKLDGTIIFKRCKTEAELLRRFIDIVEKLRPDVLCGWYNKGFDDGYMLHRIDKVLGPHEMKRLSPSNSVFYEFKENKYGKMQCKVMIKGLQILDYIDLYKKYIPVGRESWSLNYISSFELGDTKVDYDEYDNLKEFYQKDPQLATDYNIYDVELIDLIEKKLGLIELTFTIAYMAKCNFEDVNSPIRTWDAIIYNHLKERNIVIPAQKQNIRMDYPGAYVKDPVRGIYEWVMTYDLASLYPHLIMQFNISTETIVDDCTEDVNSSEVDPRFLTKEIKVRDDMVLAASGQYFRKDIKGFFPELMETIFNTRKAVKNEMKDTKQLKDSKNDDLIAKLDNKQLALKIVLNSAYGAMGSPHFRYFDIRLATAITMSGQMAIRWVGEKVETMLAEKFKTKGERWVYSDTDSCFFVFDFVANKLKEKDPVKIVGYMDKFSKKYVEPYICELYEDMANYVNANENKMFMEREKIMQKFLITGKKHYAHLLWDDEGFRYDEAELKVTGIEVVRSSTPQIIKPYLKESLRKLMLEPDSVQDYVMDVKKQFMAMTPEQVAFPRGVSNVKQYTNKATMYKKGCPIAVRAAIIYNEYCAKHEMINPAIEDGEKIKFFYATVPNPFFNSNVFGFVNRIPDHDKLVKYVDYSKQFEKVYFDVIKNIAERVGFTIFAKQQTNLEDLF